MTTKTDSQSLGRRRDCTSGHEVCETPSPCDLAFLRMCPANSSAHRAVCEGPGPSELPVAGLPATLAHCDTLLLNAAPESLEGLLFYLFGISLDNLIRLSNLVRCPPCDTDSFQALHSELLVIRSTPKERGPPAPLLPTSKLLTRY